MSLYASLMRVVESHIAPLAGRIGSQRHIIAIRDGFISAMPFLIVGSIMLIVANPPFDATTTSSFGQAWLGFAKKHWDTITMPFFMTMGLMSVFVSIGTAYSLAKHYKMDALTAALLSLMAFLLASAPQVDNKMSLDFLGGQGVFTALICAIWSVELILLLKKYNITIRMPEQVPPTIARSFELLYPVVGILLTVYPASLLMQSEFQLLLPAAIMQVFQAPFPLETQQNRGGLCRHSAKIGHCHRCFLFTGLAGSNASRAPARPYGDLGCCRRASHSAPFFRRRSRC